MEPASPSDEERVVRRWRFGHAAVFVTFALLILLVVGFLASDGPKLFQAIGVSQPAATIEKALGEDAPH
jgi:hypothetical protein